MSDSWGNLIRPAQTKYSARWRTDTLPETGRSLLAIGNRRSYGDVCINDGGTVIDVSQLSKFIAFDESTGIVRCESGITLWEVAQLVVPRGWFLPVTPGTSFVTIGGAVANDVHGKNHHVAGSFGCFVRGLGLQRSNGDALECSVSSNPDLFSATIGGCGLTGLITWVEFSLKRISNPKLSVESIPYSNYRDFLRLSEESEQSHEYCVSWIDCLAVGPQIGAGVFFRANHIEQQGDLSSALDMGAKTIPAVIGKGFPLVNRISLQMFNSVYKKAHAEQKNYLESFGKFFYPLDSLLQWNRIYGRAGFYQFQCVVPFDNAAVITDLLSMIRSANQGSFLSVLKTMGDKPSPGMMSFCRPGVTLALDFPNGGKKTTGLLKALEAIVNDAAGAIYPAKDAVMADTSFKQYYPRIEEFSSYVDPAFSSSFWRRVKPKAR